MSLTDRNQHVLLFFALFLTIFAKGFSASPSSNFQHQQELELKQLQQLLQDELELERKQPSFPYKRAAFMGMRGKKDGGRNLDLDGSFEEKRAAFMGMRGKKDLEDVDSYTLPQTWMSNQKRAGFVGMRGRRGNGPEFDRLAAFWPYSSIDSFPKMRRGGNSGFVGMRG